MIVATGQFAALTAELEAQRAGHAKFDVLVEEARQQLAEASRILGGRALRLPVPPGSCGASGRQFTIVVKGYADRPVRWIAPDAP